MNNTIKEVKSIIKKDSKFVKKIKQKIYGWHRTIGIITIIPVIFWTLSGLMHPFMAHFFKPEIANEHIDLNTIEKHQLKFSIQEVLSKNNISEIKNFRIVQFDNTTFYQVKTIKDKLEYFDSKNAKKLENGDLKYAHWLARFFINDQKSRIIKTNLITNFTSQYKYVNRYLPVYKVVFNRSDAMEVYVETVSSKLATYNPKSRQFFIWFFDTFHNWAFLDTISNNGIRIFIMLFLLSIICFSAISGIIIYGLFWKQFKKTDGLVFKKGIRKYHRQIGIWISIFTLFFAFSGAYHATTKWEPNILDKMIYEPKIAINYLKTPSNSLIIDWKKFENISLVNYNNNLYYRCVLIENGKYFKPKFKNKTTEENKEFPLSEIVYINSKTNTLSKNLDINYALFLASYFDNTATKSNCCEMESFSEKSRSLTDYQIKEISILDDFDRREYGFVNKRLPVVKIVYNDPNKTSVYVEIATSRLAAKIENSDRYEGYSFAFLHKFLFMDWAGKNLRDLSMVIAALTVLIVSVLGLILFLKRKY